MHKFDECRRLGMALNSLNALQTTNGQFKFSAVFVQSSFRCVVSPHKGLSVEEFMRGFLQMQSQFQVRNFCSCSVATSASNSKLRSFSNNVVLDPIRPSISKPTVTSQMLIFAIWQQPGDPARSSVFQQLRTVYPASYVNAVMKANNINLRSTQNASLTTDIKPA